MTRETLKIIPHFFFCCIKAVSNKIDRLVLCNGVSLFCSFSWFKWSFLWFVGQAILQIPSIQNVLTLLLLSIPIPNETIDVAMSKVYLWIKQTYMNQFVNQQNIQEHSYRNIIWYSSQNMFCKNLIQRLLNVRCRQ